MSILRWFEPTFIPDFSIKVILSSHMPDIPPTQWTCPHLYSSLILSFEFWIQVPNASLIFLHEWLTTISNLLWPNNPWIPFPTPQAACSSPDLHILLIDFNTIQFLRPNPRDICGFHKFPYLPHPSVSETSYLYFENNFQICLLCSKLSQHHPCPCRISTHLCSCKTLLGFLSFFVPLQSILYTVIK